MASALVKKILISNPNGVRKAAEIFRNATRNHWNYQYKPGPYPKTPAERAAAAKKYGMTIEEYQPYPEHMCYGDYPKLPDIGADSKDPFYPYDHPELKRNFNEPIHASQEIYGEDRYDISMKPRFSLLHQWTWFLGVIGGSFALYIFLEDYKFGRPVTIKQYPKDGPHYLFCQK
ncbi:PREDICTED: NADH dehydrogenase [ubiquinone] 1 beta subcomplex subunit 8, mitochondrial [Papilio polytes]|uniref:NADH dehydrogenase [ubiquinone] 1 beta subcomplex subunit 8, mitochondrial n=1 Tax=Papilio polytes TaxID=76194 RepID=UPI0006762025|nr:PREDICTED: NADH dehydrogenase [ubiquinone] 1 beta subcomplex subunit 8, mitochondrial [Papilio polytes]